MLFQPKKKRREFDRQLSVVWRNEPKLNFCGKFKAILSTIYRYSNCKQSVCKGVCKGMCVCVYCLQQNQLYSFIRNMQTTAEERPEKHCENLRNCLQHLL